MPDFDNLKPSLKVTDPILHAKIGDARVFAEYPRHLHKPGGEYCVVLSDDEKAAKLKEGWGLTPASLQSFQPAKK